MSIGDRRPSTILSRTGRTFSPDEEVFSAGSPCRTYADMERAWAGNQTAAFLTIENGSALAGDLSRVQVLADQGVRAVTLVWNGENEIGSGHTTDHGLSAFEKRGDPRAGAMRHPGGRVSPQRPGFYDLLEVAQSPFWPHPFQRRGGCGHRRNLTDEMIREMVDRDCLIGLKLLCEIPCGRGQGGELG